MDRKLKALKEAYLLLEKALFKGKVYRGMSADDLSKKSFEMPTYTKDLEVAQRYAGQSGFVQQGILVMNNPLRVEFNGDYPSQVALKPLMDTFYFEWDDIADVLRNVQVRDYSQGDYEEVYLGREMPENIDKMDVVVFDMFDSPRAASLLKKYGYDGVIYQGWEGDESLEYRPLSELQFKEIR